MIWHKVLIVLKYIHNLRFLNSQCRNLYLMLKKIGWWFDLTTTLQASGRLIRNRGGHCVTTLKVWTLIPISAGGGDTVVVGIGFCHAVDHGTGENLHKISICYLSSSTYLELTVEVVVAGYQVAQADSDERYSQSMNLKTGFWTGVVLCLFSIEVFFKSAHSFSSGLFF